MDNFSTNKICETSMLESTSPISPSSSIDCRNERLLFAPCSTSNPCLSIENGIFPNGSNIAHSEGQSLREFDEKLQSLQKENFNLKLRIFFLEERKENGGAANNSSNTAKCNDEDITKHNIDLKIENEDLRKELQKKQELLCQAAKAIELIEESQRKQVESSSTTIKDLTEQIECLQNEIITLKSSTSNARMHNRSMTSDLSQTDPKEDFATSSQNIDELQSQVHAQKRIIADKLCTIQDLEEKLAAKTKAHEKGCKTIQHLLIKVRDLDDEISRLKVETKNVSAEGAQLDQHTDDNKKDEQWREELTEVCNLLASRLKELAGFLDSLLKHDEVLSLLSKNHHDEMRRAVNSSLDLSYNISLCNEVSLNGSIFSKMMDETNGQGVFELAKLHETNAILQSTIQKLVKSEQALAVKCKEQNRMLGKQMMFNKELAEQIDHLHQQHESHKMQHSKEVDQLLAEKTAALKSMRNELFHQFNAEIKKRIDEQRIVLLHELNYETDELKKCIEEKESQLHTLKANMECLQAQIVDKDAIVQSLKRSLDEATLQTSKAVLERTKYMNERDSLEKSNMALKEKYDHVLAESSELHTKLAKLGHKNAQLHNKLVFIETKIPMCHENIQKSLYTMLSSHTSSNNTSNEQMHSDNDDDEDEDAKNYANENDFQNMSMEFAIEACDSDNSSDSNTPSSSKSSKNDSVNGDVNDIGLSMTPTVKLWNTQSENPPHDCEKIEQENVELKRKLEKTRKAFEKTWAHLRISNQRKEQIEKDIRNEIYKTHNVLKSVRSNMENAKNNKNH